MAQRVVSIDFETDLIGPESVIPEPRCCAFAWREESGSIETLLLADGDPLGEALLALLEDPETYVVCHKAGFDYAVWLRAFPEHAPALVDALDECRLHCTIIREKLWNLSSFGSVDKLPRPDGSLQPARYDLAYLVNKRFGRDRTEEKTDADSPRLLYAALKGKSVDDYPQDMIDYALQDAVDCLELYEDQEERREEKHHGSIETEWLQVAADVALALVTERGMSTDPEAVAILERKLEEALKPENLNLLYDHGLLRPGVPARPHKNGAKNPDGTPKMTKEKPPSKCMEKIHAYVEAFCKKHGIEPKHNDPTDNNPEGSICVDKAWRQEIRHYGDPVLEQYDRRELLIGMVTRDLPNLQAPVVHPTFDVLKRSGRTSSKKSDKYPSVQGQNPDPRIRPCVVARPGYVLCSIDYDGIELCSLAQQLLRLFGRSKLADIINAGKEVHSWFGSLIAYYLSPEFKAVCNEQEITSREGQYDLFMRLKDDPSKELRDLFAHFRKMAKPTDLGYPGGLGAETFATFAKDGYGVEVDLTTAQLLKDLWLQELPEMGAYFARINNDLVDPKYPDNYCFTSPLGMFRANSFYCGAANGEGLQTPTSEGAKVMLMQLILGEIEDPRKESPLRKYACGVVDFLHDEVILEIPEGPRDVLRWCYSRATRVVVESMQQVFPEVRITAKPAIMRRWFKKAEPVYGDDGILVPWEPEGTLEDWVG